MVGRELPNSRPNGEDHRGAGGGGRRMLRNSGTAKVPGWRRWARTRTIRITKALGLLLEL